jgi:tetratricopeptide (TPR) repeat protein
VLHRDLKPQNIMLGPFGEVLVVDWGLAKSPEGSGSGERVSGFGPRVSGLENGAVAAPETSSSDETQQIDASPTPDTRHPIPDPRNPTLETQVQIFESRSPIPDPRSQKPESDDSATQAGSIVGTPAYMSPEQAAGAVDELTLASDIFSLGAILYAILTGRPPYRGTDAFAALQEARAGRIASPRSINPDTPPALNAVCLKALAARPAQRFPTARDLAADVERWLADEPVSAWTEPWTFRARRWLRRHRSWVIGAACLLITAVAGLAIGLVAVRKEQQRTEERRIDAEIARHQALASAQTAAEHRKLALQTLQSVIFDMQTQMRGRPGMQGLQQDLLLTAQRGLDNLAKSVDASDEADRTKAIALVQLGEVYRQYADVGGLAAARTQFDRALQLYQRLNAATPGDRELQRLLADCLLHVGDVALPQGQSAEAEKDYREARSLVANLVAADSSDAAAKVVLADAEQRVGDIEQAHGHSVEALAAYRESNRLCRELADQAPDDVHRQTALAASYDRLARLLVLAGKESEAIPVYENQLKILKRLIEKGPATIPLRRDLAGTYQSIGNAYRMGGDVDRAVENLRRSAELLVQLERDDPQFVAGQATAAMTFYLLGYTEWLLGRTDAAIADSESARERFRRLMESDPGNLNFRASQTRASVTLVNIWLQIGKTDQAIELARDMRDAYRTFSEADPSQAGRRIDYVNSLHAYVIVMMFVGQLAEAKVAIAEGLGILRELDRAGALAANSFAKSLVLSFECKRAALAGDVPATEHWAAQLAAAPGTGWLGPFHAACALGWADKAIRGDRSQDQLTSAEREKINEIAGRAIGWLRDSARLGLRNIDVYLRVPELEQFRMLPRFRTLIGELELQSQGRK